MIAVTDSISRTGSICLLLGLLTGCASWGVPPSRSAAEATASDSADEPVMAEDEETDAKARRQAAVVAFEAKRDQIQYEAALAQWHSGDTAGCQTQLEEQLARQPKQPDKRLLLTDVYLLSGQPDRALESARIAARQFGDDAGVLHSAGLTFEALGYEDEAFDYFRRSFAIDDQTEVIRLSYQNAVQSAIEATAAAQQRQSPSGGVSVPSPAVEEGEAPWQLAIRTLVDASQGNDSRRTATLIAEFVNRHETEPDVLAQAGKFLLQRNQPNLALHLLESALEQQTESAAVYRVIAMAYYRTGDYEASRRALHFSLSLDKSSALSYFLMGATLSKLGMSEPAERSYRRSVQIDPRYGAWR